MVIIAMTLYLPQHIAFLTNRAWFYYNGDESAKAAVRSVVETAASTKTILVEKLKETLIKTGSNGAGSAMLDARKEL